MAQTHYIEIDEEIISAVGRLRKTHEAENIFVFPKRALILQSIVSLRLLQREAQKLGKKVIVMTQDMEGKLLAEKAGFMTQDYHETAVRESEALATSRFTVSEQGAIPMPQSVVQTPTRVPQSKNIGSTNFFGPKNIRETNPQTLSPNASYRAVSSQGTPPQSLRIRNASPPLLTSLNSARNEGRVAPPPLKQPRSPIASTENYPTSQNTSRPAQVHPTSSQMMDRHEKLHRFLSGAPKYNDKPSPSYDRESVSSKTSSPAIRSTAAPWVFAALGLFSAIAIAGAVIFLVLPQAEIIIVPQGTTTTAKYQLIGLKSPSSGDPSSNTIPARVVALEKEVSFLFETTGEESGSSQKAQGTVIISNEYSAADQPLVATTRLSTADGKIFRLVEGVTVPGIRTINGKQEAGVIEAKVVADQPGEMFNIEPTEFSIPGFQGSPKFDKFSAKSTKPMTGGGLGGSQSIRSVTQSDLDAAQSKAKNDVRTIFRDEIVQGLPTGEKLIEESIEVLPIGTPSLPIVGTSAASFDFQGRFRVQAFVISEQAVNTFLENQTLKSDTADDVVLKPVRSVLTYGTPLTNYSEERIELSVQAELTLRATIDSVALRNAFIGLDEEGIRNILKQHPEIKRLRVEFQPRSFVTTLPKDPDRIKITINEEEE